MADKVVGPALNIVVAHRFDEKVGGVFYLAPQSADVHVDRTGATEVVVSPYLAEQGLPGEHTPRARGQEPQ